MFKEKEAQGSRGAARLEAGCAQVYAECRCVGQAPGTAPLPSEVRRCPRRPLAAQQGFQEAGGQGPAPPSWAGSGGGRRQPQMTRSPPLIAPAPGQLIALLCSDAAVL